MDSERAHSRHSRTYRQRGSICNAYCSMAIPASTYAACEMEPRESPAFQSQPRYSLHRETGLAGHRKDADTMHWHLLHVQAWPCSPSTIAGRFLSFGSSESNRMLSPPGLALLQDGQNSGRHDRGVPTSSTTTTWSHRRIYHDNDGRRPTAIGPSKGKALR